jgi:hypothetical protein
MTNKQTYSATIFYKPQTKRPRKYRNINNKNKFIEFTKIDPDAYYINWYNQKSGIFESRHWVINFR